jgi:hypothetical protein
MKAERDSMPAESRGAHSAGIVVLATLAVLAVL